MPRVLIAIVLLPALGYLALCALLYFSQRSLLYFPQPRTAVANATVMTLPSQGETLMVTSRPMDGAEAIVYFGGNAEDVSGNLPLLSAAFPRQAIYLLHYRGYGGSSGSPTEDALFADALALFDKVHADHAKVTAIGRSLGSGVAIYLATRRPVAGLVLVTPYDSIQEIAARRFPYFPVRWLLRDKFESWKFAPEITVPTLILAAAHDEVIPGASTEALLARFRPGLATCHVLPGTGHNDISASPEYLGLLAAFK
ncbi:MAG TPA: alpha/beta fold hydrolase [Burkholderiales bacterium]|nr:alpha/beta fold hydrolase [Burkholderiales bacterium]